MLVWLALLSAFAIISHQQFLHRRLRPMFWLPSRHAVHYDRPDHYGNINGHTGQQLIPKRRITGSVGDGPEFRRNDSGMKEALGEQYPRVQRTRIADKPADLRFFFYAHDHPFLKTATITITSTQNLTSVQSCLPLDQFYDYESMSVVCKRKRREILDDSSVPSPEEAPISSSTESSQPQKPLMTILPVVGQLERGARHLLQDPALVTSSKDDVIGRDESTRGEEYPKRENRFLFYHFVTSTTVYSFVLNSFVITKTVYLAYNQGDLICRPSEFVVCS